MDGPILLYDITGCEWSAQRAEELLGYHLLSFACSLIAGSILVLYQPADTLIGCDNTGETGVLFHGHLHNQSELETRLGMKGISANELLVEAFMRYGKEFFDLLRGDFSVAAWNTKKRRMFLAVDFLGTGQWFYTKTKEFLICATSIGDLRRLHMLRLSLNEGYLLATICYRTSGSLPAKQTAYKDVYRLAAGHYLQIDPAAAEGGRQYRYWQPDRLGEVRCRPAEYAERFVSLLKNAVDVRIRDVDCIYHEISGGMDSSIIAVATRALLEERYPQKTQAGLSFGFLHSADEYEFQKALVERGLFQNYRRILLDDTWIMKSIEEAPEIEEPAAGCLWYDMDLRFHLLEAQMGAGVVLVGDGGDEITGSEALFIACDLKKGRVLAASRNIAYEGQKANNTLAQVFQQYGIDPLLPAKAIARFASRTLHCQDNAEFGQCRWLLPGTLPWLSPDRVRQYGVLDAIWLSLPYNDITHPRRRSMLHEITHNNAGQFLNRYIARPLGIEKRAPLLDRNIVEFMMQIPFRIHEKQDRYQVTNKLLFRQAYSELLPPIIHDRAFSKFACNLPVHRGLQEVTRILGPVDRWELSTRELIDSTCFESYLSRARLGRWKHIYAVVATVAVELWLHNLIKKGGD